MEKVLLTRNGQLFGQAEEKVGDPLPVLPFALECEKGCTLRSFFHLLERYPDFLKLSRFLSAAVAETEECPASGCMDDEVSCLVVGKTMELIGFPGKPRAELYLWLRGIGPLKEKVVGTHAPDITADADPYSISLTDLTMLATRETRFIPMQLLLDTPLLLGGLKHVILGDADRNLVCESRITLFELMDGLAWEFGFRGGSQQCSLGR